ncbi:MAG: alpha/beta fold hydrolase [Proteobacteria bacterium]|nr:alpha/beta fold hydrolase [Pseudomonadota bacterium]
MGLDRLRVAGLLVLVAASSACASLADRIVQPPTQPMFKAGFRDQFEARNDIGRREFAARGGNRIVYRWVPAADYGMHYTFVREVNGQHEQDRYQFDVSTHPQPVTAKGTVVFLHGWGDDHTVMMVWALALARHGYIGVLPDLRNYGQSDRAPASYGPREAQDVVDLLAMLRARGDIRGPTYLVGLSLGADVAVLAAADPDARVDGVIAMEPYVNAAAGIRAMIRFLRQRAGSRGGLLSGLAVGGLDDAKIDAALTEADRRLGIDLASVDIGPALRATSTCTLLVQGAYDGIFDSAGLRAFADAPNVRNLELPRENHFSLAMRADWLGDVFAKWLGQTQACALPMLPKDPAEATK